MSAHFVNARDPPCDNDEEEEFLNRGHRVSVTFPRQNSRDKKETSEEGPVSPAMETLPEEDPNNRGNGQPPTTATKPWGKLDPNAYATKKTIAQGMLDVALLTANASQLKHVLSQGTAHQFYYIMVVLISLSIILQIAVGILLIALGATNCNKEHCKRRANLLNNLVTGGIFLITLVNVLISSFGLSTEEAPYDTPPAESPGMLIGIFLAMSATYNINDQRHHRKAEVFNDLTTILIFVMMGVNVFVSAIGSAAYPDFPVSPFIPKKDNCTDNCTGEELPDDIIPMLNFTRITLGGL